MKAKINNGQLEYFKQPAWLLGDATAYATEHGYKEVVYPTLAATQLLGNPIDSETVITFAVVEKSAEQLMAEKLSEIKAQQDVAINEMQIKQVQITAQTFDDATALDNKLVYPLWEAGIEVELDKKYLYVMNTTLYKVLQAHTTQANWTPDITPALWKVVQPEGVIPDFVQPTGVHDAYMIGEKVKFNGSIYESLIDNNVYSPTAHPQGWKELLQHY